MSLFPLILVILTVATPLDQTGLVVNERRGSKVHTIDNQNPYNGMPIAEGRGNYLVIFEPLQNVQASRSTYKVTSFIDFEPYLQYFQNFETYLLAFKANIDKMEDDPIMRQYINQAHAATTSGQGEPCTSFPHCRTTPILTYKPIDPRQQLIAYKRLQDQCISGHIHACLTLRQFEYIRNVTDLIDESYQRVKRKFLQAIDYVENSGIDLPED